ncbi:MAG: DUF1775 domain-containing protein [Actinocatenispora sp.]
MRLTTRSGDAAGRTRLLRRALLVTLAGLTGALALAAPAAAHVTVNPKVADPGSYARVAFRVPTESDNTNTTKLEVYLPTDQPLTYVGVMPVPGWTAKVDHAKPAKPLKTEDGPVTEVVSKITWTADDKDAAIRPGEFQEFPVSLGSMPKSGSLTFKALQTYSDGSVVRWIQSSAGGAEPDHPAPVLTVGTATPAAGTAGDTSADKDAAPAAESTTDSGSGTTLIVAVIGLVAGLAGLAMGGMALTRSRRS